MTPFYKVYVVKMFLLPNWFYVLKKGFLENLAAASLSLHLVWLSILVFQLCVGSLLLLKMARLSNATAVLLSGGIKVFTLLEFQVMPFHIELLLKYSRSF